MTPRGPSDTTDAERLIAATAPPVMPARLSLPVAFDGQGPGVGDLDGDVGELAV